MGKIRLERIIYKGDTYKYESPKLKKGINVIIGENGCGKSTLTYLIYFVLGNDVPFFNKNHKEKIKEITEDTNGIVFLEVFLNDIFYIFKRRIDKNEIHVKGDGFEEIFSISRKGYLYDEKKINFSDWLLEKLNFGTLEISQFNTTHRINFDDLMNLIYYDQKTELSKIFKESFSPNSLFFKDSSMMKKNIFEILMGNYDLEYYLTYFEIKDRLKKKQQLEIDIKNIEYLVKKLNIKKIKKIDLEELENLSKDLENEIIEITFDLKRIISKLNEGSIVLSNVKKIENNLKELLDEKDRIKEEINSLLIDIDKGNRLYDDYEKDVNDLKKIILTSQSFDFQNFEKCPFCSEPIKIEKGKCLCGSSHGLNYEKFMFTDEEYMKILKSKIKAKEQIEMTLKFCHEEVEELMNELKKIEIKNEETSKELKKILNTSNVNYNEELVEQLNHKKINAISEKQNVSLIIGNVFKLNLKKEELEKEVRNINRAKEKLGVLAERKDENLSINLELFEKNYENMMKEMYPEINKICLDQNYKPVINNGEYKEESRNVPKRFFYYISLLLTALEKNTSFPNFLLIDSISNKGISNKKLEKILLIAQEKLSKYDDYQIILTSGKDEFPEKLNEDIIEILNEENKLLKNL